MGCPQPSVLLPWHRRVPSDALTCKAWCAGGKRGLGLNEERDQTLNQLLTELDGFEVSPGLKDLGFRDGRATGHSHGARVQQGGIGCRHAHTFSTCSILLGLALRTSCQAIAGYRVCLMRCSHDLLQGRTGVLLLAATNRPEVLDPALTRPGRLSRRVSPPFSPCMLLLSCISPCNASLCVLALLMLAPLQVAQLGDLDLLSPGRRTLSVRSPIGYASRSQVVVPLPDQQGRADILAVHLRQRPLALSIGDKPALCQTVARMTRGEAP